MNGLTSFTILLCSASVGVSLLSVLAPQKRTKRTLSFVLGLFILVCVIGGVKVAVSDLHIDVTDLSASQLPTYDEIDYDSAVAQQTADILVSTVDELLRGDGITADDIRISVKISSDGRIYADRVVIYISEQYRDRKNDIKTMIKGNLSKEPDIYVKGQEAERADNG